MAKLTFDNVLEALIDEYRLDGHKIIEQEGVHFAQIELIDGGEHGVKVVTEQNLTRMADAIVRRAA